MDLRVYTEPQQGADYAALLRVARAAEALDYGAFFRSDHYLKMGGADGSPGSTDAWITLAGIARETSRIRLGTLMTAATFRLPGVLAIQVAQVDQMSGGRVELGLGTGWYEAEHVAYGIPFPADRFARLEEQLEIITGMWATKPGDSFSFSGRRYTLTDCPALPKPAQERVPMLVGGTGTQRTPALAAKYATEFNVPFKSAEAAGQQFARVRAAAEAVGRDPGDLVYSMTLVTCVGTDDAEVARRAAAIGHDPGLLRLAGVAGTPDEAAAKLAEYAAVGAERVYLQILDLTDLDHLELIADRVRPQLG
ncbi:MAG: TIGR03560 family F420-dependent LLM class oxidoreductase [Streptosporangiaceae bacterium]